MEIYSFINILFACQSSAIKNVADFLLNIGPLQALEYALTTLSLGTELLSDILRFPETTVTVLDQVSSGHYIRILIN